MQRQSLHRASFRPRASLGLFYFFGFFTLFVFLLAAPTMWQYRHANDADPQQRIELERAVQETVQPRLWIALALAAVATIVGGRLRLLPGTR